MARTLSAGERSMEDTIKVEDLNNIEKRISIHVASATVNKKFTEFFNNIKKEAQISGFRKGKVPVKILQKRFKSRAEETISQMLMSEFYQCAIKDYNISPIGQPEIKDVEDGCGKFNDDNSYDVELTIEVLPNIDPVGYDDLELQLPDHDIDDLCNSKMAEYQENFAEREQVLGGEAKEGDTLVIDFKGYMDGEEFEGGEGKDFSIEDLCSGGSNVSGFEEQIVGMRNNESKRITATFLDENNPPHLAGKDVEFDVTVHSIVRKTKAEVDEDLAMIVGYESVEELRKHVQDEVESQVSEMDRQLLEGMVVKELIEKNDFDVPKSLMEQERDRITKQNNIENPPEHVLDKLTDAAKTNVKKAIILDAIYEKEDIDLAPDELSDYLEEQAKLYGKDKDEIVSMLYNSGQMDSFVSVLKARKAIDFIIDKNTKKDEEENEPSEEASDNRI
jgi:trigger factor